MATTVTGQILNAQTGFGLINARVELWADFGDTPVLIAAGGVRAGGVFAMTIDDGLHTRVKEGPGQARFRVSLDGQAVRLEEPALWHAEGPDRGLVLRAHLDRDGADPERPRVVLGRVTIGPDQIPAPGLIVRAFDVDLRQRQPLGEARTDDKGRFEIRYSIADFARAEKTHADIALEVLAEDGKVLHDLGFDGIAFNAGARLERQIHLDQMPERAGSEYAELRAMLAPLLGDLNLVELQDDAEHQDLDFLAAECGVPKQHLTYLVLAERMNGLVRGTSEAFYGVFRMETLVDADPTPFVPARFDLTLADDPQLILAEAARIDPGRIKGDLSSAIRARFVSDKVLEARTFFNALERARGEASAKVADERRARAARVLDGLVTPEALSELGQLLSSEKPLNEKLTTLGEGKLFAHAQDGRDARLKLSLVDVLGDDGALLDRIARRIAGDDGDGADEMRRLAQLGEDELAAVIRETEGEAIPDAALSARTRRLKARIDRRFPTEVLHAELEGPNPKALPVTDPGHLRDLLEREPEIRVENLRLDRVFAEAGLTSPDDVSAKEDLKRYQRVRRLAPRHSATVGLINEGIGSALAVVATGRARFLGEVAPAASLTEPEALRAYDTAVTTHSATLLISGELQATTLNLPDAVGPGDLTAAVGDVLASEPNLQTLFQETETCLCPHCRSVLSPAAYLVELLEFLDRRGMVDLNQDPPVRVNLAKDILLTRRPDIADIDLNCANADRPLPYIDLVCEILEEVVQATPTVAHNGGVVPGPAPSDLVQTLRDAGWRVADDAIVQPADLNGHLILRDDSLTARLEDQGGNTWLVRPLRQTRASVAELDAMPEYLSAGAYQVLAGANIPLVLPFDLSHTEAAAYFHRFGIKRPHLMGALSNAAGPGPEAIAAEALGLTDAERQIVTTPDPGGQAALWGASVAEMRNVATLVSRTGLTYERLDALLQLAFIDPRDALFIHHLDLTCDLTQKEVQALNADALDRLHRFLRLSRATGLPDRVLSDLLVDPAVCNGALDGPALVALHRIVRLAEETGIAAEHWTGAFGRMPHQPILRSEAQSLHAKLFEDASATGIKEPRLTAEAVAAGGEPVAAVSGAVAASLGVTGDDLGLAIARLPDGVLSFGNLSRLFLTAELSRRLKIAVPLLHDLIDLTGHDPFAGPAGALDFVTDVARLRATEPLSGLRVLLTHAGPDAATLSLSDNTAASVLTALQIAYQAAFDGTRPAVTPGMSADELRGPVKELLAQVPGLDEAAANDVLRMMDGGWASPPDPDAAATLDALLGPVMDTVPLAADLAAIAAAAPGAALEAAWVAMADRLLGGISEFLYMTARREALVAAIAEMTGAEAEAVDVVLAHARLTQPGPQTPLLADLLQVDALIDRLGSPPAPPAITPAAHLAQFQALRLLHKMMPVVMGWDLAPDALAAVLGTGPQIGWPRLDALPFEAGMAPVAIADWARLAEAVALFAEITPVTDPGDPARPITLAGTLDLLLPGAGTPRAAWLDRLGQLTGHDRAMLDALDQHLGLSPAGLAPWREPATWTRFLDAAELVRKLGTSVAAAAAAAQPVLTATEAASLRAALKTRYSEATWLITLAEIMDVVRARKRDALVAYLVATRPEFPDARALFEHYLIDVQMGPKIPASRIVQAHGAIQMFVERSRMGLEPAAAADSADTGWDQWEWMRRYRLWEANRKIFLWPENWHDPSLVAPKSELLSALEASLLQNEVTDVTTEAAVTSYLESLDDISFLEVVACYYQTEIKSMHVFARTKGGDPAQYYHRIFERERSWTPWTRIELEITSDKLLAFARNGRLNLAWTVTSEEVREDQNATVPPVSGQSSEVPMDRPEARLRIQLAVSEYAAGNWKPQKLSRDAVLAPPGFTLDRTLLDPEQYNLIYQPFEDHVWVFRTEAYGENEGQRLAGVFDIAGCKGYPEVIRSYDSNTWMPDFYPDIRDTHLRNQRYHEIHLIDGQDLSIRNALTPATFVTRLNETPRNFRITHPHQITGIDLIYYVLQMINSPGAVASTAAYARQAKLPMGTWMPYFFEDSVHGYAIVPGFYGGRRDEDGFVPIQRTFSDIHQFVEDVLAFVVKYLVLAAATPPPDPDDWFDHLINDPELWRLLEEAQTYAELRPGERFLNLYHPLICPSRKTLYSEGMGALMSRRAQLRNSGFDFVGHYQPNMSVVANPVPVEDIAFQQNDGYAVYNWELFFHVPLMIAKRLANENRFEDSLRWFHRIFDPTGTLDGPVPQKYWVTRPFFERATSDYVTQRIDTILNNLADPNAPERHELEVAVETWRARPYRPHDVARFRTVAYQKTVVMNYVETLIAYGDFLFGQDQMEPIFQAVQLYELALRIMGPEPQRVPPPVPPATMTYNQIAPALGAFGNALVDLETYLPDLSALPEGGAELPAPPVTLASLYFCVPQNDKLSKLRGEAADRLRKIRASQTIDGVERVLSLFAPPIDPGMLARAVAGGVSLSALVAGLSAPLPSYRFMVMAAKATELVGEVRQLGGALLTALEKRDGEELALLRGTLEHRTLKAQADMKALEFEAAGEAIAQLDTAKDVVELRRKFYEDFEYMNDNEKLNLDKLNRAHTFQMASGIVRAVGAVLGIIPDFSFGGHGAGGSPAIHATFGGSTLATVAEAAAGVLDVVARQNTMEATRASLRGGYDRRMDDAKLQLATAIKELRDLDQQQLIAELRKDIAKADIAAHDTLIDQNRRMQRAMEYKYTNRELYQWMASEISGVYYQAYKLAFDAAKRAERCFNHELGRTDTFIAMGYWDSQKKGLQAADGLMHDIKRMESRYMELNRRELELTRHISLRQLDPLALIRLRNTGQCDFEVPEVLYDMDFPGHYFRRIKSVSLSIPCVAGPHTAVSATLTQVTNRYRKETAAAAGAANVLEEHQEAAAGDTRFVYNVGVSQAIATSSGQRDAGLFQLDFRGDDRYLPFEGTGAIGTWRLEMPGDLRPFDYATISDVVLHVSYTARNGGSTLAARAAASLPDRVQARAQGLTRVGLHSVVDLRRDMSDAWHQLRTAGTANIALTRDLLPYWVMGLALQLGPVTVMGRFATDPPPAAIGLDIDGNALSLNFTESWQAHLNDAAGLQLDTPFALTLDPTHLGALTDLCLVLKIDTP